MLARRITLIGALLSGALACTGGGPRAKVTLAADGGGGSATKAGQHKGGYLVVSSPEPRSVNPITQAAFDVATPLIFEPLVGLDARGEEVPVLAEKWERSPDGKVLTFRLRKNVKW